MDGGGGGAGRGEYCGRLGKYFILSCNSQPRSDFKGKQQPEELLDDSRTIELIK